MSAASENRKRGLCRWCGCWAEGYAYCLLHREYFRAVQRKRNGYVRTYKTRSEQR